MNILVDLANVPPIPIPLGKDEQNAFNTVIFDARTWGADFPGATYTVLYQRPTGDIYPVLVNQPGPLISWTPSAADTTIVPNAPAYARAEIRLMQGDALGKSATAVFGLTAGILSEAPAAPVPDWATTVAQNAAKAEAAVTHYPQLIDGDLWIWNPTSEQWEKLIISEGGNPNAVLFTEQTLSAAQKAQARDNIGAKIPLYLAYDSTTQTVNLTPSEIEALSAAGYDVHLRMTNGIFIYDLRYVGFSAPLQVAALAAECNGTSVYAFVNADKSAALAVNNVDSRLQTVENDVAQLTDDKADKTDLDDVLRYSLMNLTDAQKAQARTNVGAGTYSKPSGGIPKTDLAQAVQTSLGKADTALQTAPVTSVNTKTGAVTLTASDVGALPSSTSIPTKTSDLTNDSNFQTAAQVSAAIGSATASKADKTLRVAMTASDTTPTLDPNKLYVFPTMASLTPTLNAPSDNSIVNEYHFIFTSGATATTLTLPAAVLQPDGFTVEANHVYEVSILENCMTAQGWAVSA